MKEQQQQEQQRQSLDGGRSSLLPVFVPSSCFIFANAGNNKSEYASVLPLRKQMTSVAGGKTELAELNLMMDSARHENE